MTTTTIGKAIDEIAMLQKKRDEIGAKLAAAEKLINEKKEKLLARVKKSELNGAKGRLGAAFIQEDDIPTIEEFEKVWSWAKKNDALDIFQKRLSNAAVRERWAVGKKIPGVGTFHRVFLQVRSVKRGEK